ncbi:MAG: hypothetical protein COB38_05035 [Gammaproteobacteria bacterium]|nr:MAG: hypothetical protein COB38_05035 [Gammaproteobacteria bacterium]
MRFIDTKQINLAFKLVFKIVTKITFSMLLLTVINACGSGDDEDGEEENVVISVNLTAEPLTITAGESTTITWSSTNANQCTSNEFTTNNQTSGNVSLQPETSMTFSINCSLGAINQSSSISVTVNPVNIVTVTLIANPTNIQTGESSNLSWQSSNAETCSSNDFSTNDATSGNIDVQPNLTTSYVVSCVSGGMTVEASASVTVTTQGSTFYVATSGNNNDDGSQSFPWRDIQFAVDQLSAGETLIVNAGSYGETVLFSGEDDSGSSGSPISVVGLDGAIIDGSNLSPIDRQGLITIRDAKFIVIENLELSNFRTASGVEINDTPVGILIDGSSSDISLINNVIHHIENLSSCHQNSGCGPGANGIAVYGNTTSAITGLILDGNEVYNCILAASESFTINGNVDGFKVLNNYVHNNNNIGIDVIGYESDVCASCTDEQNRARNGLIKGNRSINNSTKLALGAFTNNPWYGNDDGSAGGFYVDGGRNIIFDGNYSSQNDLGFEFASEHSGKASDEILMINNYIYNNREVGLTVGGYAESTNGEGGGNATNIYIYNNSFYKNKGWGTEITFSFRVINATLANNILYGEAGVSENFEQESNGQLQNISWINNIWWAPDVSDTSGVQGSSIIQDPLFTDPINGNLDLLSNSPAIDVGQMQSDLTNWNDSFWQNQFTDGIIPVHGDLDINAQPRISSQIDIGADEF